MDQPRKVAKPSRGQLNREIKFPCRCIRGKFICTVVCICLHTRYVFYLGTCTFFVHGSLLAVYANMCDLSGVGTHYVGACHYLTNRFQMEAPVAPSRSLREASVGMAEAFSARDVFMKRS